MSGLLSTGIPLPPNDAILVHQRYEWGWEGRRQGRKVYHALGLGLGPLILIATIGLNSQSSRALKTIPGHLLSVGPTSGTCHLT